MRSVSTSDKGSAVGIIGEKCEAKHRVRGPVEGNQHGRVQSLSAAVATQPTEPRLSIAISPLLVSTVILGSEKAAAEIAGLALFGLWVQAERQREDLIAPDPR